jgi:hypothetical protein
MGHGVALPLPPSSPYSNYYFLHYYFLHDCYPSPLLALSLEPEMAAAGPYCP